MREVPVAARLTGLAGAAIPLGALGIFFLGPERWQTWALAAIVCHSALMLTLTGGGWWGLAASAPAAERRRTLAWLWTTAGMAALTAFACLVLFAGGTVAREPIALVLGFSLLLGLAVDSRLGSLAPRWWMAFRGPQALAAGAASLTTAFV